MKLLLVRSVWGVDPAKRWEDWLLHRQRIGYEALEASSRHLPDPAAFVRLLQSGGLAWIPQVFSHGFVPGGTVEQHLSSVRQQITECLELFPPLFVNSHSGSDSWNYDQACHFFAGAQQIEKEFGVVISHETHRGRCFFNPWSTRDILSAVPGLKLTADFSHWVCVGERLLPDCGEIIELAAAHTFHVHARVGFEEGPQALDPSVASAAAALAAHEAWWDMIWEDQRSRGMSVSTLTPEFGPPPHLRTRHKTAESWADLNQICDWMALRQRARFETVFARPRAS